MKSGKRKDEIGEEMVVSGNGGNDVTGKGGRDIKGRVFWGFHVHFGPIAKYDHILAI